MKPYFVIAALAWSVSLFSQKALPDTVFSEVATKQARTERRAYLVDTAIRQYLANPLTDGHEDDWNDGLWAMELLQFKDDYTRQKLIVAWSKAAQLSENFQMNLLETTYSLYRNEFKPQALKLMQQTRSVPIFIRCAEYVLRADPVNAKTLIGESIKRKFAADTSMGLRILQSRIATKKLQARPPLKDIFGSKFLKGKTVIYSLQRSNRDYAGLVIIRKPDGTFVRDVSGDYFHTSQLARAITAYPFYITFGNTPQGILHFSGFEVSTTLYIGPTRNLQLQIPYEITSAAFLTDSTLSGIPWSKGLYASMIPPSWKNYDGIYESFYAGAMGRNEIIMHGTTIDPAFYKSQTWYPQTPSLGCLCSYEAWDESGHRISSNQQKIVDALDSIGSSDGYVVVIDIDNQKKQVRLEEVRDVLDSLTER